MFQNIDLHAADEALPVGLRGLMNNHPAIVILRRLQMHSQTSNKRNHLSRAKREIKRLKSRGKFHCCGIQMRVNEEPKMIEISCSCCGVRLEIEE